MKNRKYCFLTKTIKNDIKSFTLKIYAKGEICKMQLEECYASFQGNYEDVKSRLGKEDLIKRLVLKFLKDTSFEKLSIALDQKDYGTAFRAVHTLKGLSLNFGFDCLSKSTGALTETLRKWEKETVDEAVCEKQWQQVSADYRMITDAIRKLEHNTETDADRMDVPMKLEG